MPGTPSPFRGSAPAEKRSTEAYHSPRAVLPHGSGSRDPAHAGRRGCPSSAGRNHGSRRRRYRCHRHRARRRVLREPKGWAARKAIRAVVTAATASASACAGGADARRRRAVAACNVVISSSWARHVRRRWTTRCTTVGSALIVRRRANHGRPRQPCGRLAGLCQRTDRASRSAATAREATSVRSSTAVNVCSTRFRLVS